LSKNLQGKCINNKQEHEQEHEQLEEWKILLFLPVIALRSCHIPLFAAGCDTIEGSVSSNSLGAEKRKSRTKGKKIKCIVCAMLISTLKLRVYLLFLGVCIFGRVSFETNTQTTRQTQCKQKVDYLLGMTTKNSYFGRKWLF